MGSALGINDKLITLRRGVHGVDERTISYGAIPTARQNDTRKLLFNTTEGISVISLRPITLIIFALTIVIVMKKLKIECRLTVVYILVAIAYL